MNILLLTSGKNTDKNSSWLVYYKFIRKMRNKFDAKIKILCFSPDIRNKSSDLGEQTYNIFLRSSLLLNIIRRINKKYLWIISKFYADFYSKRIIRYIEDNKIEKLWVNSDLLILLLLKNILKKKTISYHISVLDDPFKDQGYQPSLEKTDPLFKEIFKNAASIDTPTPFLYNYYKSENIIGINTKVTESNVGVFKNSIPPKINNNVRKIALTGSVYGMDALIAFLSAVNKTLIEEEIEFHLTTNTFNLHLKYLESKYYKAFKFIKVMPFIPENKIISELQTYDLLYLPMKFDEDYRFQTNSSFPSKTHNYLASQIPIIVHTPKYSSLYNFFTDNNIGCVIDTLNQDEIKTNFKMLMNKNKRQELSEHIREFNKKMVENNHVKKLYNIINEY